MNSKLHRALLIAALALLAMIAGALFKLSKYEVDRPDEDAAARIHALSLPDLAGREHTLSEWRGKVVVANFWATWCPPCREEIPGFIRLNAEYAPKGVQFVGISIDSQEKVRDFAAEHGIDYMLLLGDSSVLQVASAFGNRARGLPFTVILGRDGEPYAVKLGRIEEKDLAGLLDKVLAAGA
jgi:thiol-disulfide isomerase/thioredoxin